MKITYQYKDHGVKEIGLSSVVTTGRVNADVLIHFNESLKNLNISEGYLYKDIYSKLVNVSWPKDLLMV